MIVGATGQDNSRNSTEMVLMLFCLQVKQVLFIWKPSQGSTHYSHPDMQRITDQGNDNHIRTSGLVSQSLDEDQAKKTLLVSSEGAVKHISDSMSSARGYPTSAL